MLCFLNRFIGMRRGACVICAQLADVHEMPVQRGDGNHGGADEVGAPARALAAFKVAVAGGGAALARLQAVGVHGQANSKPRRKHRDFRYG